jgi:hypothetical protein
MKTLKAALMGALLLVCAPSAARADVYLTPFAGVNFGGDVGQPLGVALEDRNRVTYGFGFGFMSAGVLGLELDLGYTKNFYTDENAIVADNSLLTVMPAVVFGIPLGGQQGAGIRPYALAGAGLVRRNVDFANLLSLSDSQAGYQFGFGVMGFLGDHFGIRGDVRYIRNFEADDLEVVGVSLEEGTFDFGRASVGAVFRF